MVPGVRTGRSAATPLRCGDCTTAPFWGQAHSQQATEVTRKLAGIRIAHGTAKCQWGSREGRHKPLRHMAHCATAVFPPAFPWLPNPLSVEATPIAHLCVCWGTEKGTGNGITW